MTDEDRARFDAVRERVRWVVDWATERDGLALVSKGLSFGTFELTMWFKNTSHAFEVTHDMSREQVGRLLGKAANELGLTDVWEVLESS